MMDLDRMYFYFHFSKLFITKRQLLCLNLDPGCGTVDKVVPIDTRDPRLESRHLHSYRTFIYRDEQIKERKKKRPAFLNDHF